MSTKQLRYYQLEAQEAVEEALKRGVKNQMLVLAGGAGKTYTSARIIKDKGRIIWGTHTSELIEQSAIALLAERELMPYNELLFTINSHDGIINLLQNVKAGGLFRDPRTSLIAENIGVIKADLFDINKPIVMASMQTLHKRLHLIPENHFDVVVGDECHLFMAVSYKKSLDHFKPKLRLLLTATPHRLDGMPLSDIADEIVYEYGIEKGIADGYLCELDAIQIKTNINIDTVKTTAGDLNQKDLEVVINTPERNKLIVEKYIEYASGRQFVAYCVDVRHAIDLTEAFKEAGLNVNYVVGDEELTPERKKVIDDFKRGEYIGLVNVQILVAGFDHPNTGCVIQTCPTKSLTKFIQSTVRGSRLKDEEFVSKFGQKCIILDFIDVTTRHRLVNTWSLDQGKPTEKKVFMTNEKKQLIIFERERKAAIANIKKDTRVSLFSIPEVVFSKAAYTHDPASEKQLAILKDHGYNITDNSYTKGMCNEIISNLPASEKQINFLKWKKYDVSSKPGLTYGEFQLCISEIKRREEASAQIKQNDNLPF
jgi:superfamily II DNA or RNA helicase